MTLVLVGPKPLRMSRCRVRVDRLGSLFWLGTTMWCPQRADVAARLIGKALTDALSRTCGSFQGIAVSHRSRGRTAGCRGRGHPPRRADRPQPVLSRPSLHIVRELLAVVSGLIFLRSQNQFLDYAPSGLVPSGVRQLSVDKLSACCCLIGWKSGSPSGFSPCNQVDAGQCRAKSNASWRWCRMDSRYTVALSSTAAYSIR